ncbi:MAG: hypothetical protein GXO42_01150 [bacterium]|nr:hypothetical protein [bacterium]
MSQEKKFLKAGLFSLWDRHYKHLLLIPIILFICNIIILIVVKPQLSYEFTGGYSYILVSNLSYSQLTKLLSKYPGASIQLIGKHKYLIQVPYSAKLNITALGKVQSMAKITPTLGKEFYRTALLMILIGFCMMVIVVFLAFRQLIPGLLMVLSIIFDCLTVLAAMCLLRIPLSLGTLSILLILIGYSIDTDILLTSRVLRQKLLPLRERFRSAMITGLTEQCTALAVMLLCLLVVYLLAPGLLLVKYMAVMITVGVLADMVFTWLFNAAALRLWVERHAPAAAVR